MKKLIPVVATLFATSVFAVEAAHPNDVSEQSFVPNTNDISISSSPTPSVLGAGSELSNQVSATPAVPSNSKKNAVKNNLQTVAHAHNNKEHPHNNHSTRVH